MTMAGVAQLAEHQFCKLDVASSILAPGSFGQPFGLLGRMEGLYGAEWGYVYFEIPPCSTVEEWLPNGAYVEDLKSAKKATQLTYGLQQITNSPSRVLFCQFPFGLYLGNGNNFLTPAHPSST